MDIDNIFEPIEEIDELAGPNPARNRKYRCKQCNYVATEKHEYWEHTKEHIKTDKMLACPKCNFVTEFKHHLVYHLRNHFGSKPFKCGKCNYSCVNKSMLNSHMKSHSNIYQYRCEDCTYATKYCHSLKLHLRKYDHRPATVLNLDGTPNPYPVIDVYGTRRGPRPKKGHRNGAGQEEELEPLKQYATMAQADCEASLPTTSGTSGQGTSGPEDSNANALKCDYCTFQTESKPDFAQHLLKHVMTEKQILIKNKKKSVLDAALNKVKCSLTGGEPEVKKEEAEGDISHRNDEPEVEEKVEPPVKTSRKKKMSPPVPLEHVGLPLPVTTTPPPTPNNHQLLHQNIYQNLPRQSTPNSHPLDQNIKVETKFFASPRSLSLGHSELTPPTPMEELTFGNLHSPSESTSHLHGPLDLSSKPESPELEPEMESLPQPSEQFSALLLMNILQQQQQQNLLQNPAIEEGNDDSLSQNILENPFGSHPQLSEELLKLGSGNLEEFLAEQAQQQNLQQNPQQVANLANIFMPILQMNPTMNPILLQQILPQLLSGESSSVENVIGLLQKMHNASSLMQEILMEMCSIKK